MNKIILLGRLVKDPELRTFENGEKVYTKFTVAVDRNYKLVDGTIRADFIPVALWGKQAEVVCKYFKKGNCISLSGRLSTGSYEDKDGNKKYVVEVIAEDFRFVGGKKDNGNNEELQSELI